MGTRGLIGFVVDGEYRGTYNQYDTYPTGLGQDVAEFLYAHLTTPIARAALLSRVRNLTTIKSDDKASPALVKKYKHFADTSVSTQELTEWYVLLRKMQNAGALPQILFGNLTHAPNDISFAKESLFCEWAYFLNLDDNTLEVYRGFQTAPTRGNVFGRAAKDGYFPIKQIAKLAFPTAGQPPVKLTLTYMAQLQKDVEAAEEESHLGNQIVGLLMSVSEPSKKKAPAKKAKRLKSRTA